jgi:hypothetical protein
VQEASTDQPGKVRLRLKDYGILARPGAPAVPVRIERIALPETGTPELRLIHVTSRPLGVLPLEIAPSSGGSDGKPRPGDPLGPPASRPAYRPDPALAASDAQYPEAVVKLGETGRLRDQRYVDLILTPVQVRPRSGEARWAEEIELEIVLSGGEGATQGAGRRADPKGAALYQGSFLNSVPSPGAPARALAIEQAGTSRVAPEAVSSTYKIGVKKEGIYRLTCSTLAGCPIADFIGQDPATFRLRSKGVEVPVRVVGGQDLSFDLGDVLQFYGQAKVDPFTTLNCAPPTCPGGNVYEYADFTDTNVYLLDAPGSAGRLRMSALDGTPGGLAAEASFLDTAHAEVNDRFLPLGANDPFFWTPTMTADEVTTAFRDLSLPLPGVASAAFTAPVVVRLRGVSSLDAVNPDHRTRLTVNGSGGTISTFDWDGEMIFDHTTSASQSVLTDPTTLHLELVAVPGVSVDQVLVDYAEISYRRQFQAVSDALTFNFANQAAKFVVQGFSGAGITAYDVSRSLAADASIREPRLVVNGTTGASSLTFQSTLEGAPTGSTRRFLVVGPAGFATPDFVTPLAANTLRDPANEADYLIIAHPSLIDATPGGSYDQFVGYLTNTRGFTVKLVFIQDIYDAFSSSIEDPEAIRSFLAFAHDQWVGPSGNAPPPSYLLLVGDATWDTKNNLNRVDWIDFVPTPVMFYDQAIVKFYSADAWLASFMGNDQSPDILFGRLPVRTASQANTVFAKLRAYATSPPPGPWKHDGYFLADVGNVVQETQSFEGEEDALAALFAAPWTRTKQYYAQPPYNAPTGGGGDVAQFKADFVSHWSSTHPAIASFSGHGAPGILGNDLFFAPGDVPLLTNGSFQPFFYNSDCLTGGFHTPGIDSMAEAFVNSSTGGAIGYFAPSGLSFTFLAETVSDQLFGDLFAPEKLRELGTLTSRARGALYQQNSTPDAQAFTFVGDPATLLVLPAPQPPTSFSVSAGNAVVNLSWSASSDPAAIGTNVYRATSPSLPYTKLNAAPIAAMGYADTTVINGTTYFYRAVSVDSSGFEGAVTNTNADCGISGPPDGPQCRRALPQNLVPPLAPSGLQVTDTGIGTTLQVSWNPNPEPDIQRYVVSYGTTQGSHPVTINAGLSTSLYLNGLTTGTQYFVVVYAVNTTGIQGSVSPEVSGTPHQFAGIAPPATIKSLLVNLSGSDILLSWNRVTTNIYGNPTVVDHYNVYRGTTPNFVPSNSVNRIATVPDSASPGYTHVGGGAGPGVAYYLVSAEDLEGDASGLGNDLPAGVTTLQVAPSPNPGMTRLTWPAVSLTVIGTAARISHYTLYGSPLPVPRSAIGGSVLIQDNIAGTTLDVPTAATQRFYYNLVVVDERGNLSPY